MGTRKADLGELETLVLLAVLRLDREAHVRGIRDEIATRGGRTLSRGAMYATIARLERKGFLVVREGVPAQGIRHFKITSLGLKTLRTSQRHLTQMKAGLESILDRSR